MKLQSLRGFTLIELLVVIAIIGILAAIILPALGGNSTKARDAKRVSELRQIRYALELYYGANGKYPACLYSSVCAASLQGSPYMPTPPKDPSSAAANYSYSATGIGANCTAYHLGASLEVKPNSAFAGDVDATIAAQTAALCTGSAAKFSGLSAAAGGSVCAITDVGNGTNNGTETCYDLTQ